MIDFIFLQVEGFEEHWEDMKRLIHPCMKEDHLHELLKVPIFSIPFHCLSKICTTNWPLLKKGRKCRARIDFWWELDIQRLIHPCMKGDHLHELLKVRFVPKVNSGTDFSTILQKWTLCGTDSRKTDRDRSRLRSWSTPAWKRTTSTSSSRCLYRFGLFKICTTDRPLVENYREIHAEIEFWHEINLRKRGDFLEKIVLNHECSTFEEKPRTPGQHRYLDNSSNVDDSWYKS